MGQVSRSTLKTYFETRDKPTESQFIDLLDSVFTKDDDPRPLASVKMFGAVGDGSADDTSAIQDAIDSSRALWFPPGTYLYDKLTYSNNTHLFGTGTATLRQATSSETRSIERATSSDVNLVIDGMGFDGNKSNQSTRNTLLYLSGEIIKLRNCFFTGTIEAAVEIVSSNRCLLDSCRFEDMEEHSGSNGEGTNAITIRGTEETIIKNSHFTTGVPSVAGRSAGGIFVSGTSPRVTIKDNTFDGIGQNAAGNIIGNIDLYEDGEKCIVSGNKFYNYRYTPLKLQNFSEVICDSNIVSSYDSTNGVASQAITYSPAARSQTPPLKNAILSNNIILESPTDGITIIGNASNGDVESVHCHSNIIRSVSDSGIFVDYSSGGVRLEGNLINGFSADGTEGGIIISNSNGKFIIGSNNIKGGGTGIRIADSISSGIFIIGKNFVDGDVQALFLRDTDVSQVVNNIFDSSNNAVNIDANTSIIITNNTANSGAVSIDSGSITNLINANNSWN